MKERLDAVGGTLHVQSAPGRGTVLTVIVPHSAAQAPAGIAV
jgi:signal transduction histidine kinase